MDDSNEINNNIHWKYSNIIAGLTRFFILLCLLNVISIANCQSLDLSPKQKVINVVTTYQFTIIDTKMQGVSNISAILQITFSASQFSFTPNETYTCLNTNSITTIYSCKASTANVIQIINPMLTTSGLLTLSIANIKNPSNIGSAAFTYVFKYSNQTVITSLLNTYTFNGYLAGSLQSCTASFSPNLIFSTSVITITMTLGNAVPSNGSITVIFPTPSWTGSANSSLTPVISSLTQSCTKLSGNSLNTILSCTVIGGQIIVSNSFNLTSPAGTVLSFSISNILSPPTSSTLNSIIVGTQNDSPNPLSIDQSTCIISAVGNKPISGVTQSVILTVGINSSFPFSFLAPAPIAPNDLFTISAVSPNDLYFLISVSNLGYISYGSALLTGQYTNSTSVKMIFSSTMPTIPTSTLIQVLNGISITPLIKSGTRQLVLSLQRNGFLYATQTFQVSIAASTLENVSILIDTKTVASLATYTFSFVLSNSLTVGCKATIVLPTQLSIINGACTFILSFSNSPLAVNSSAQCTATSNRIITVSNLNTLALSSGQKITISISSILNSQTTANTGVFSISTFHDNISTDPTDTSTSQFVTMTPAVIGTASVSSSTPVVGQQGVYTVSYTVKSHFLANSVVQLTLPSQIVASSSSPSAMFSITYINTTTIADQSCLVNVLNSSGSTILQFSGISSSSLPSSTIIRLKVSFLVNPSSMMPSSSFGLVQIDSNGNYVQKLNSGLIVTNTQPNQFSAFFSSDSSNRINGEYAVYTINFQSSLNLNVNDYLLMTLETTNNIDSQMVFANTISSCDILYNINSTNLALSNSYERRSSKLLKINLLQALISSLTYQLTISTIQRPRTSITPGKITLSSFKYVSSSSSFGVSSQTLIPLNNNQYNAIPSIQLNIIGTSQLFSFQSFSINAALKNAIYSGDYLVIQVPSLYLFNGTLVSTVGIVNLSTISSQSLCLESQYFCSNYQSNPNQIKVQQFGSPFMNVTSLLVTIKNNFYRSPSTFAFTGVYFKVQTYSSTTLMIDYATSSGKSVTDFSSAQFYLTCATNLTQYHCKTCNLNATCSSCYSTLTFNSVDYNFDGYKYMTTDLTCVTQCGVGYFLSVVSGICTKCTSPCATCDTTATKCLSCIQNITTNKYYSSDNTCLNLCPDGFYAESGNICTSCSVSCTTCTADPYTCTSCSGSNFLNSNTKACVLPSNCPSNTYPDITSHKCKSCDVSCSGCTTSSTNCSLCATGYIISFQNASYKSCSNLCPSGTVNDTINNGGCRCDVQCKTCSGTISNCLTCDSSSQYIYFYVNTCVSTCPLTTYQTVINGVNQCQACSQSGCKFCDSTTCSQCSGQLILYQGACISSCQISTVMVIISGVMTCQSCSTGCKNCDDGVNSCSTCQSGLLLQSNSSSVFCSTSCSSGYVSFNNSICYTSCPSGYQNISSICRLVSSAVTVNQLSTTKTVPFPFTIASIIFVSIVLLSKLILPYSLVSTLMSGIVGVLQPCSWIIVIIVTYFQTSDGTYWNNCSIGVYLLILALVINFILNIIALLFFMKYVQKDDTFNKMMISNQKKVLLGRCPTITIMVITIMFSHKGLQLLFSNFLGSKHFSYKLKSVTHIIPLNYILFSSILPSCAAIAGGSLISYELQNYAAQSSSFIASIDMIIITILGIILSIWVTNRSADDYEIDIHQPKHQTHYQTEQILIQGANPDDISQNINEIFLQQSGLRNTNAGINSKKNYYYKSSRISDRVDDHDEDPLSKRKNHKKPIDQNNPDRLRTSTQQQSSQALVIHNKGKRRNLKDQFTEDGDRSPVDRLQVIQLSKNKRKASNSDDVNGLPITSKFNPKIKSKSTKPQQLLQMTSEDKQNLKDKIQSKLDDEEQRKLQVLARQKQLRVKKRKQRIQKILKMTEPQTNSLPASEKLKISKIKQAVDLLKRKQIKIQQYLIYNQIIKQEDGQYDEDNSQISQIQKNQKFKDSQFYNDSDLQEVINLSPKKSKGQRNLQQKPQKRKSLSKQKTIKKQSSNLKSKLKEKKSKTNQKQQLNDLQVNYNANQTNQAHEFDEQQQPQLPKVRSNIVKRTDSNNRSFQQFKHKKGIQQLNDQIQMINIGSARNSRLKNNIFVGGQLQEEHSDTVPPKYLHSTEKVNFKPTNQQPIIDRNVYDSQNDRQTLKSFQNGDTDFFNEISPSQFNVQNQRFQYIDQSTDMPIKPQIIAQSKDINNPNNIENKTIYQKNDGFDIYDEYEEEAERVGKNGAQRMNNAINNSMNRQQSSSSRIDYDSILRKNLQNEKLKQLQQIYLPRLQSKPRKKQKQTSRSKINQNKL